MMSSKENGNLLTTDKSFVPSSTKPCSCFKIFGLILPLIVVMMVSGLYLITEVPDRGRHTFIVDLFSQVSKHEKNNQTSANRTKVPANPGKYVTFSGLKDGRGLGNQLFNLASVVYFAELSDREPAIVGRWGLDDVFELNIERFEDLCPCYQFGEYKSLTYDPRVEQLASPDNPETQSKSVILGGFYQSWKYTESIDRRLRTNHLRFNTWLKVFADEFFKDNIPPTWKNKGFTRVGIHVRRGDVLNKDKAEFGYTTPNETYFVSAMHYFTSRYRRVQFIVASNDMVWTKEHIRADPQTVGWVDVRFSEGHTTGEDFTLLSLCDHVIMSTGTFGWWAAYIAKGTTIFYQDWPAKGTPLYGMFQRNDFFLPNWIGMSEIHVRMTPAIRP